MNKREFKILTIGVIIGTVLVGGIATASALITGDVFKNSFPILLNGNDYTTKMPILNYQDRTYVPLRELATLTGNNVDFKDNKVIIDSYNYSDIGLSNYDVKYLENILTGNSYTKFKNVNELTSDQYLYTIQNMLSPFAENDFFDVTLLDESFGKNKFKYPDKLFKKEIVEDMLKDIYGITNVEHKTVSVLEYNDGIYNLIMAIGDAQPVGHISGIKKVAEDTYEVYWFITREEHYGVMDSVVGMYTATVQKTNYGHGFKIVSNVYIDPEYDE